MQKLEVTIQFDNESDGEIINLSADQMAVKGVEPHEITDGNTGYYEFETEMDKADFENDLWDNLDKHNWCVLSVIVEEPYSPV